MRVAARDAPRAPCCAPLPAGAGQPRDRRRRQAVEPRRELAVVLLGEDFGRRHERDLLARFDRLQRGQRGDDRLAGADVALQQPLHRRRALQVVAISRHTRSCARVSLNGTRVEQLAGQRAGAGQHRRAPRRARLAMHLQRQLLRQQLVELEPRPRRMRARVERALRQRDSAAAAARAGSGPRRRTSTVSGARMSQSGSVSAVSAGSAASVRATTLAQRLLAQSRRGRIDRRQAVGQRRVLRHHLELRMHHFQAEVAVAHLAEHAHALAQAPAPSAGWDRSEEAQHELRARAAFAASSSRQTSWRRGRYWMSVLTIAPSACSVDARARAPRAATGACGPRSAVAGAGPGPRRARCRAARAGRRVRGRRLAVRVSAARPVEIRFEPSADARCR